jgi:type I restriction enzyme S subunit
MKQGAGQPNLNTDIVKSLPLMLCDIDEQKEIVDYIERELRAIDSTTETIKKQINKLREYRQALITAAVTGKIDVRGEAI